MKKQKQKISRLVLTFLKKSPKMVKNGIMEVL